MAISKIAECRGAAEEALRRGDRVSAADHFAHALAEASSCDDSVAAEILHLQACLRQVLESEGRYAWVEIYKLYVEADVLDISAKSTWRAAATLEIQPFVGPLRIGVSEGRGRGLFLTQNVAAGTLVMCAEAVAAGGPATELIRTVAERMLERAELQDAVLCLSRGKSDSEASLPTCSVLQLASPGGMCGGRRPIEATWEELMQVVSFNQFALPRVDVSVTPISISTDNQGSGLWLLPAFLNHSCLPNVQKVIVGDRLFLRTIRELPQGAELFDSYVEVLKPLVRRREALEKYGFVCACERCMMEEAVLDQNNAQRICALVKTIGTSYLDSCEAVSMAESLVDRSLHTCLASGKFPALLGFQLPDKAVPTRRMSALRDGAEKPSSAEEEEALRRQTKLRSVLLASFGELFRAQAVAARVGKQFLRSNNAWETLLEVLSEVQPCSEVASLICTDVLANTIATIRGDPVKALRCGSFRRVLLASHRAYGGGVSVWLVLSGRHFSAEVRAAARDHWATLLDWGTRNGLVELGDDSYDVADMIRQRKGKLRAAPAPSDIVVGSGITSSSSCPSTLQSCGPEKGLTGSPIPLEAASAVSGALASNLAADRIVVVRPTYQLTKSQDMREYIVHASLPGLNSGTQVSLDISECELRFASLVADLPHTLVVPLPLAVDVDGCTAKWLRRKQTLIVYLPIVSACA